MQMDADVCLCINTSINDSENKGIKQHNLKFSFGLTTLSLHLLGHIAIVSLGLSFSDLQHSHE